MLLDLYENIQLSFRQIHSRHFRGLSKPTVQNRLTKIMKGKYLKKRKFVGLVGHTPTGSSIIYQLSKKGVRLLEGVFVDKDFNENIPMISHGSLSHDLLLTEVLDAMRILYPNQQIINSRLAVDRLKNGPKPDAFLIDESQKVQAIELELTAKSDKRYRDLVLKYRLARDVEQVIYVVSKTSIAEKILSQINGRRSNKIRLPLTQGKFHIMKLKNVLNLQPNINLKETYVV